MPGRDLPRIALSLLLACTALALAGCGGGGAEEDPDPPLRGERLTIYSSLPLHGPARAVAADVLAAQRLALAEAGDRVGPYRLRLVALDAADPVEGRSDPSLISENARRAVENPTTIAYLGELASGMSAISIPLLNEAGILEVSPLDSAMALTTGSVAVAGSPLRFYPKLDEYGRTFARVVPSDRTQAAALVELMAAEGVRRLAVLTDEDPSGRALATRVRADARAAGIALVAREEIDVHAPQHEEAVARLAEVRPDAVFDGTGRRPGAASLWRELAALGPDVLLYAPASLADERFLATLGPVEPRARVTRPLPGAGGGQDGPQDAALRRFERAFAAREGRAPLPEAAYGYESMRSLLTALRHAARADADGRLTRGAAVDAYFRMRTPGGVLGAWRIDEHGDTTSARWGAYRVKDGRLRLARPLAGDGSPASGKR